MTLSYIRRYEDDKPRVPSALSGGGDRSHSFYLEGQQGAHPGETNVTPSPNRTKNRALLMITLLFVEADSAQRCPEVVKGAIYKRKFCQLQPSYCS